MPAFARLTAWASAWSGSPSALVAALALTLAWAAWGVALGGSELWSGVGGGFTGWASLILLVLLQSAQSRDTAAIRAQLRELVRASPDADNRLMDPERVVLREDGR